ncbi:LacI family DNA-binding transcriptional regulator [[Ruminococcus] torques]|nr:LacI family DNA-binding transcriptional regulator [[Ruminococcus] torques]
MAVTVKQIAELANVSRGTVDRVLNNRSESARQRAKKF